MTTQPCNKISVEQLSVEEQAVLRFWGQFGYTYLKDFLRGYQVRELKQHHLAPLRTCVQGMPGMPESPKELSKWATLKADKLPFALLESVAGVERRLRPPYLERDGEAAFHVDPALQSFSTPKRFPGPPFRDTKRL